MNAVNDSEKLEKRVIRRVTFRLIPFMFILYIVAYLDRINVGFAALQMNAELSLSHAVFGLGGGIFFIGYFLFEIPSNLILHRVGARLWIARIMISWGLAASAMMFVSGPKSFYTIRFLLGLAEAGFFPGMILYLTYWFPGKYLARNVALFMTATPLAGVIGGPVSGAFLEMHGFLGVSGWQWLFLLEGMPAVILGVVVLFYLPERPEKASWLPEEEKAWLLERLHAESAGKHAQRESNLRQALKSARVWVLCLIYFSLVVAMYGVTLWMPLIIKAQTGLGDFLIGVLSIFPYLAAAIFMVVVGISSDRTGERRLHLAGSLILAALGFLLSSLADSLMGKICCLVITAAGIWGGLGPFWAFAGSFLSGTGAAGGIALINSIGNLGGFVGPTVMGLFRGWTGSFNAGLLVLGGMIGAGGILAWLLRFMSKNDDEIPDSQERGAEDE
ncbi:MAG: MFS transporter [Syntrophales bacterium]|nr:MFS transporter [Syntrophales bacterium]